MIVVSILIAPEPHAVPVAVELPADMAELSVLLDREHTVAAELPDTLDPLLRSALYRELEDTLVRQAEVWSRSARVDHQQAARRCRDEAECVAAAADIEHARATATRALPRPDSLLSRIADTTPLHRPRLHGLVALYRLAASTPAHQEVTHG